MKSPQLFKITRQDLLGFTLVSLPILIYWVYWTLHPSYWLNSGDPGALYFIDSLSVFAGGSYVYVDHPGTPMQLIGSLILALTYPFFESREAFIGFFIARPGVFFLMANTFLLIANLFCAIVFYKTVKEDLTQNRTLGAIAITLLFFALHPFSYQSLTLWSHNSLNYPFGTLLIIWLYRELKSEQEIKRHKLVLLGLASGILAIAQMYFLAWIIAGVFTVFIYSLRFNGVFRKAVKAGMDMVVGGLTGILLMLLPIYKELPRFVNWLRGIVSHLSIYGTGTSGVLSLSLIPLSFSSWWSTIRFMVILLLFNLIVLIAFSLWTKKTKVKPPVNEYAITIGLLFHIGLLLLLMIKTSIKLRYSLSLAGVLPILVFLTIKLTESTPWKKSLLLKIFYILILTSITISLYGQKKNVDYWFQLEKDTQLSKDRAINYFAKKAGINEDDVVVVYAYATPLKCAGMLQASNWTGHFKNELSKVCPNQYAIWDSNLELNTAAPSPSIKDINWDIIITPGTGQTLPEYLETIGAINVPKSWNTIYPTWFFIHSKDLIP